MDQHCTGSHSTKYSETILFRFNIMIIIRFLKTTMLFNCIKWQQILISLFAYNIERLHLFSDIRDYKTDFVKCAPENNVVLCKVKNPWFIVIL